MKTNAKAPLFLILAGLLISALSSDANAGMRFEFAYTSRPADVRVWMSPGDAHDYDDDYYTDDDYYEGAGYGRHDYDVYPAVDNLVLNVRPSRSCYVTVYLVDADGYIHVVHPLSPRESAYLRGGRVYRFHLGELGFYGDVFGRGVAFAYAVASPVPFVYSSYGVNVFGPRWGFRIYGDPYVASRQFYVNLIGGRCDIGLIGVSHARFYVREYVRYPSYLCVGWHNYYGVRTYCRGDCSVHRHYRMHARAPYRVLHPRQRLKRDVGSHTRIAPADHEPSRDLRVKSTRKRVTKVQGTSSERLIRQVRRTRETHKPGYDRTGTRRIAGQKVVKRTVSSRAVDQNRVVRSSKDSFVKSKSDISVMRQELKKRNGARVTRTSKANSAQKRIAPAAGKSGTQKRQVRTDAHSKKGSKVKQSPHASEEKGKGKKQSKGAKSSRTAKHGKS